MPSVRIGSVSVPSAFVTNRVNVTTATTRVQLSATSVRLLNGVTIRAHSGNTGVIYVGGSAVAAANGYQLPPGMADIVSIDDLNKVWIDAAVSGDGVSIWYNT